MAEAHLTVSVVGQQRQLDSVRRWVGELAAGRGRAALVEGEPGIGKSSLMGVAAAEAEKAGCQVFWASCDELSQAFPLLPLLDAVDKRDAEGRARGPIVDRLRAASAPGNQVDVVAAAVERLLVLVDDFCTTAPVMLVVDDLQWADQATVLTLGRLVRSVRQVPLLVVGVSRQVPRRKDIVALRRSIEPDDLIRLHSLAEPEVAALVRQVVGGRPGPRLLELAAGAAGNPLYLTELLEALIRSRALSRGEDEVELTGGRIPGSLSAAIADRLEFLPVAVRSVLRAAALLGVEFAAAELAVVSGQRVSELLPLVDEAVLAGVLRGDGRHLAFRHPLIRAALYEGMPSEVRAAWHRDAARALAEDGAPAERVARQLLPAIDSPHGAGAVDEWLAAWLAGSAQLLVGQAPDAAIPLLRWAVDGIPAGVAPHDVLACRLADALYRVGDATSAAQVVTAALAHVTRPDLLVDLHWTLTQCRAMDGRSEDSLASLERALAAPQVDARDHARLLVLTARVHRSLGRVDTAGRIANTALAEATAAGDRWATGWALNVLTIVYGSRGDAGEALPLFDRALAVSAGDPALADLRLVLQINQAVALGELDRYTEAIVCAEQARQLADEAGNVVRLGQAQSVLGELLFEVGRWDDALAEVDLESPGAKHPRVECSDYGVAASILLHRGHSTAAQVLADAESAAARIGDRMIGSLALARSLEREQADRPTEALAVLVEGLSDVSAEVEERADLLADAVRLALAVGDEEVARSVAGRAARGASTSQVPHRKAVAIHCQGLLDRDPVKLRQAGEHYRAAGRLLPQAQAVEAAGVALADRGDLAGARVQFTEAYGLYSRLGADWDLARTQARFRAYGIRRGPHVRHRRAQEGWSSLTPTELKVVRLVAKGMSNPQIAAQLFLSRRTVQTHVSHILAKLNLNSRIDVAREASRRDPQPPAP